MSASFSIRTVGTVGISARPTFEDSAERVNRIIRAAATGNSLSKFYTGDLGTALDIFASQPFSELFEPQVEVATSLAQEIVGREDDYIVGGDTLAFAKIVTVNNALGGEADAVDYLNDIYLSGRIDLNDILEMMEIDSGIRATTVPLDEPSDRLFGSELITFCECDFIRLVVDNSDYDAHEFLEDFAIYERSFRAVLGDARVDALMFDVLSNWDELDFEFLRDGLSD